MPQQKLTIVPVTLHPENKNILHLTLLQQLPPVFARLKRQMLKSPFTTA